MGTEIRKTEHGYIPVLWVGDIELFPFDFTEAGAVGVPYKQTENEAREFAQNDWGALYIKTREELLENGFEDSMLDAA